MDTVEDGLFDYDLGFGEQQLIPNPQIITSSSQASRDFPEQTPLNPTARRRVCSTRQRVRNARRRVWKFKKIRATTGRGRVHTVEIGQRRVSGGRQRVILRATMAEIVQRRVAGRAMMCPTPRGRVASTVYKGGGLVQDSLFD